MKCDLSANENVCEDTFEKECCGGTEAQNRLVEENIGLVHWALRRFGGRGCDMEELFQVGAVGLVKAARRFDAARGLAFSTYAVPVIIGEIRRFLRDDGIIHVSRQIKEDAGKIAVVKEQWEKTKNRKPTLEELQTALGLDRESVLLAIGSTHCVESIHAPVSGENDGASQVQTELGDKLQQPHSEQDELVDRLAVRQVEEELDEKARKLIMLRYRQGLTQQQTAERLGMNQVAVSRLEKKILLHFRKKL
jgi:RNA polymerase sporulation-specific sigma factor